MSYTRPLNYFDVQHDLPTNHHHLDKNEGTPSKKEKKKRDYLGIFPKRRPPPSALLHSVYDRVQSGNPLYAAELYRWPSQG